MPNPRPARKAQEYSPKEIEMALTIFIKSGSSNGIESNRKECLRLVKVMSNAPRLLDALEAIKKHQEISCPTGYKMSATWNIANASLRECRGVK